MLINFIEVYKELRDAKEIVGIVETRKITVETNKTELQFHKQ